MTRPWYRTTVAALVLALGAGLAATTGQAVAAAAPAADPLPVVSPTPQSMESFSSSFALPTAVRLVLGAHTDPSAVSTLTTLLRGSGVSSVTQAATPAAQGVNILLGGHAEGLDAGDAQLAGWGLTGPAGLPSGGYALATGYAAGGPVIVLDGVDAVGTFYAVQTFRQLLQPGSGGGAVVPGVRVRDWPSFGIRGGEESFYGDPWPQADALHQLDFLAEHKMNALLYTAGNDPRTLGSEWRSPYPPDQLANFAQIVARAKADHVDFSYRIDPEAQDDPQAGICHSDPADLQALLARYEQLWSIGVRTVSVGWDDDGGQFVCASDTAKFGSDPSPLAAAQAYVTSYVYTNFVLTHPGARLITVASEYAGDAPSTYRSEFSAGIPAQVQVFWTGPQVVSPTITRADYDQASAAFGGRKLLIFDNYPVNDYATLQQHLGPLTGRDPNLAGAAAGIMANEMLEEEPSLISLFTIADFAWNAPAYNPQLSWQRSLEELGGPAAGALAVYAANSVDSPLNTGPLSPAQSAIATFLNAYTSGASVTGPAAALTAVLRSAAAAPATIRADMPDPAFVSESSPWLDKLTAEATAALAAVAALTAQAGGDRAAASTDRQELVTDVARVQAIPQVIAPGVYERLTAFATAETGRYLGTSPVTVAAPAGGTLIGAGAPSTLSFTLTGLAPDTLTAQVSPRVPAGWQASVAPATVSLASHNRSVQATLLLTVTPPAGFTGLGQVGLAVTVPGAGTTEAAVTVQVAPAPAASYPALVSSASPAGYWRLDGSGGTEADSSGHGNDGHDVGAVTSGAAGALAGSSDTAVTLSGGYVDVPSSASLALTGPFTVEAWVKPAAIGTQQAVVEKYDTPAPNGYILRIGADGRVQGYVDGTTVLSEAVGGTVLTPGRWYHLVSVYDGNTITVYVDGVPDGSATVSQPPGAGVDDLRLGARGDDAAERLTGGLDEVAVYPSALTAQQVQQHYLAGLLG